jgi:putative transposase
LQRPFSTGCSNAFVEGQWLQCTADAFLQVQGRSEREWQLILDEWREQQRQHARSRVSIDGPLLARFLEELATEEQLLLQQQRDLEGLLIREAIVGQPRKAPSAPEQEIDEELDLATLPRYEEYC